MKKKYQMLIIVCCQWLVILAMEMVNPFMPLYVQSLTKLSVQKSAWLSGVVIAAPMITMIITMPLWGILADYVGHKKMLLRASLALSVSLLISSRVNNIETLLIVRLCQGAFAGFIASIQAYAMCCCAFNERGQVLARLQSTKALATCVAGVVGGSVLILVGLQHLFLFSSGLVFIACLLIYFLLIPVKKEEHHRQISIRQMPILAGFPVLSLIFLSQLGKFIPNASFSLYAGSVLKLSAIYIGLFYSLPAMAIIVCAKPMAMIFDKLRFKVYQEKKMYPVILYFLSISTVGIMLMFLHASLINPYAIMIVRFLWGFVFAGLLPALFSLAGDKDRHLGLRIGMANSVAKVGNLSGILTGGYIASLLPLNQVFYFVALVYGFILCVCFIYLYLPVKKQMALSLK